MSGGMIICAAASALRLLAPASTITTYVGMSLFMIGSGFVSTISYGVHADNTLYIQYKTGKRAEAAIASLTSLSAKISQGVTGALPGYVLAAFGFVEGAVSQPQSVNNGVIVCSIILPLIFCLAGGLLFMFGYNLNKQKVDEMAEAVTARK